jgi:putative ABC transport system permease protein
MTPRELWIRLTTWGRRDRLEAEVSAELDAHVELLARDLEREGMPAKEALDAARRQVGHTSGQREATRDAWGFPAVDTVLNDIRYAARGLLRSPGFTVAAVLTLALGIGANAAMFAVIDRLMFRPLPYLRDPGSVSGVYLQVSPYGRRTTIMSVPYTRYLDLASTSRSFSEHAAVSEWRLAVGTGEETRVRKVAGVSASLFGMFEARPAIGRFFGPADDEPPLGSEVAILSYGYWQAGFGGRDVLGQRLRIGLLTYTIIGVAPPGFIGASVGRAPELFVPITTIPATMAEWARDTYYADYRWDWVQMLVRRKPGVSKEVAAIDLSEGYRRSRAKQRTQNPRVLPDSISHPIGMLGSVHPAAAPDAGMESRMLLWISGVAVIVLLIACANVANLMLARVLRRRREVAVRLALGVSRARLAFLFVAEGLVLAGTGIVVALIIAQLTGTGVRAMLLPEGTPFNLAKDPRTLAVAAACAVLAALLTVAAPMSLARSANLTSGLKAGARDGGYRASKLRASLLVVQGALSVALLVGAALFVRSLDNVLAIPLGFDVSTVLDVYPDFRGSAPDSAGAVAIRRRLLATAQAIPGVEAATRINSGLFATNTANLRVPGIDSVEKLGRFNFQLTSPDYFRVMRTRILRGRAFDARDGEGSARAVIVSQAMGRALWPGKDALGQCLYFSFVDTKGEVPCATVVGIAEDAAHQRLLDDRRFVYYLPVEQIDPRGASDIYVRMTGDDVDASIERVRKAMQAAMPGDGFVVVSPVQKRVDDSRRAWRLGATLFLAFGGLAMIVAAVGLYGVIGYDVTQRMHELGVRIALGATSGRILSLVLRGAMATTLAGVMIGLSMALAGSRWLQPLLFQQSARDPRVYAAVGGIMILVAVVASAIPAWRAARADPNRALRAD